MKKQLSTPFFIALLLMVSSSVIAQSIPIRDTLQVNSIQASVQSNGAFFQGGTNGQFLVPATLGAAPSISLMKSAGLYGLKVYTKDGRSSYFTLFHE